MSRSWNWFVVVALAIAGAAIGVWAYNAGYDNGLAVHNSVQVVRYGGGGFGFFPFLLFPLLFLFFAFRFGRRARWRGGPWRDHGHLDDWHEHAHERERTGL